MTQVLIATLVNNFPASIGCDSLVRIPAGPVLAKPSFSYCERSPAVHKKLGNGCPGMGRRWLCGWPSLVFDLRVRLILVLFCFGCLFFFSPLLWVLGGRSDVRSPWIYDDLAAPTLEGAAGDLNPLHLDKAPPVFGLVCARIGIGM